MQINIKATNMELTEAIRGYVNEKNRIFLDRFFDESALLMWRLAENQIIIKRGGCFHCGSKHCIFRNNFLAEVRMLICMLR